MVYQTLSTRPELSNTWPLKGRVCVVIRDDAPFLAMAGRATDPNDPANPGVPWWDVATITNRSQGSYRLRAKAGDQWCYLGGA